MLTLYITGLRIYNGKSVIMKNLNSQMEKNHGTYFWVVENGWFCWRETLLLSNTFPNNTKLRNRNRRHSLSQYNQVSFVF